VDPDTRVEERVLAGGAVDDAARLEDLARGVDDVDVLEGRRLDPRLRLLADYVSDHHR